MQQRLKYPLCHREERQGSDSEAELMQICGLLAKVDVQKFTDSQAGIVQNQERRPKQENKSVKSRLYPKSKRTSFKKPK